jgi:predicted unusual protein kinase regulating ubiquinone biosynthesis (AarF/ABC1/UbiB family)
MFHADLHPANLLILPGNMVGYVDFGITGVLSRYSRRELVSLTLAYTRADLDGMCVSFFKVSSVTANSDIRGFRRGLQRYADEWYEARGNKQRLRKNFTLVMLDMLRLSRRTDIWPERDVIKYIRSSIAIDGLITRFAPGFDVGEYLEITCARYLRGARQPALSSDVLVSWSLSNSRLIRDGAYRVVNALDQVTAPDIRTNGTEAAPVDRQRVLHLSLVTVAMSLLMTTTGAPAQFGFNLFTAELALLGGSALLLVQTLVRLR